MILDVVTLIFQIHNVHTNHKYKSIKNANRVNEIIIITKYDMVLVSRTKMHASEFVYIYHKKQI